MSVDLNNAPLPGSVWAAIGALSGVIEVCVNQPTVSWKNSMQQKQPISFAPSVIYRGTFINAASIAPITAIQFGVVGKLTQMIKSSNKSDHFELASYQKLGVALAGGAVSSTIVCPADMLMIRQQQTGLSLFGQYKQIANLYGHVKFYKGFTLACGRESIFTAGYMGLPPIIKDALIAASPSMFAQYPSASQVSPLTKTEGNFMSSIVSNLCSGAIAGILTHPIDSVKTNLQSKLEADAIYQTPRQTANLLWQEGGIAAFYKGVGPRTLRICVAVLLFQKCNEVFAVQARKMGLSEKQISKIV